MKEHRWAGMPVLAFSLRAVAFLGPFLLAIGAAVALSRLVPAPGHLVGVVAWWAGIAVVSTIVLRLADRYAKRLLPLAVLMKLSLVFPDRAPRRFAVALRSGSTRRLERMLAEAEEVGKSGDVARSAEVILALSAALNAHDPRTRGHTERVRAYADMLGDEMGLGPDERNKLAWAAMLHDIGKLRVPREIINRPGRLGGPDWEVMRNHPRWGMELAAPLLDWLGEYAGAIGQHHERFDGTGYPDGLAGEEICLAARITAVADAFDVMTSVRSYKDAHPASWAREELARNAGGQFDPVVVRAFLNIGIGRQRWVAGPLSWLAQIPILQGALQGGVQAATTVAANTAGVVQSAAVATALAGTLAVAPGALGQPPAPEPVATPTTVSTTAAPMPGPDARADSFTIEEDRVAVLDVLANDAGPLDVASLEVTGSGRGTAVVDGVGVTYTPPRDFDGADHFVYRVCSPDGRCANAVVRLTVLELNDPPAGPRSRVVVSIDGAAAVFDPLAGFADPDGDPLHVELVEAAGAAGGVVAGSAGTYTPLPGFNGTDRYSYVVSDGRGGETTVEVLVEVWWTSTTTATRVRPAPTTTITSTNVPPPTTTTTTLPAATTTTSTTTTTTSTTTTTVAAHPPMYVYSFKLSDDKEGDGVWDAKAEIRIKDADDHGLGGAVVTGRWSGAYSATVSATTKGDGKVTFLTPGMTADAVTFTIISVSHPAFTYTPSHNQAPATGTVSNPYLD